MRMSFWYSIYGLGKLVQENQRVTLLLFLVKDYYLFQNANLLLIPLFKQGDIRIWNSNFYRSNQRQKFQIFDLNIIKKKKQYEFEFSLDLSLFFFLIINNLLIATWLILPVTYACLKD